MFHGSVPDGEVLVSGNPASAWRYSSLPVELQARLNDVAERSGCRNPEHLLSSPPKLWQPKLPAQQCDPACIVRAQKLKTALATAIARRDDPLLSAGELTQIGLADYRRAFGHPVSRPQWHFLFHRTIERAGASGDFSRLEIYLDARPARKQSKRSDGAGRFAQTRVAIQQAAEAGEATHAVKQLILCKAIQEWDELVRAGVAAKGVKAELFDLLETCAAMPKGRDAVRKKFERAYCRFVKAGRKPAALKDRREAANKKRRRQLTEADRDAIIANSVLMCGGRLSQGYRDCVRENLLSEPLVSTILSNPSRKSYVPEFIRRSTAGEIKMLMDNHHGPKQTRDNGAYLDRCWGKVPSLAWLQADDVTWPIYYFIAVGGKISLLRGQCLLVIDARSTCILGYALIPEAQYNALAIRTLLTNIFDEHGLPTRGFYFERGIWENSLILVGRKGECAVEWQEAELGLREFGLEFKHAIRARSKPIERVIGAIQNDMEGAPGYCGRNEQTEKFEAVQKQKLLVQSGKAHPSEFFYDADQFDRYLEERCERYNAEPQGGKMTEGLSPEDALEKFKDKNNPPTKLDASCRYLLAHHKRPIKVTANGITLYFGKQAFNYRNEETGKLRGQTVVAWFSPESPEILTVMDTKRENPFCVERSQQVPAIDATPEEMRPEMARIEAHMGYAKTRYRVLKAKYEGRFRGNFVSPSVVDLGRKIEKQRAATTTDQKNQAKARKALGPLAVHGRHYTDTEMAAGEELKKMKLNTLEVE